MRLTDEEKKRIHAAIAAAEARTQVHIATAIVPASDHYALYPVIWGALAALIGGGIVALAWRHLPLREGFAIEAALFVAVSLLLEWWPLRIRLVPRRVRHLRASAFAHREFAARVLADPARRSGLLLFVSLGERYAEILADREMHNRVGPDAWNRIVADLVAAAKSGRIADGIVAAIEACAASIDKK
jgi:putative membrane protein